MTGAPQVEPGTGAIGLGLTALDQRRARVWRRVGPLFGAVWLVFLAEPASATWGHHNVALRVLGLVGVAGLAVTFAWSLLRFRWYPVRPRLVWAVLGVQLAFVVLTTLAADQHGLVGLVFVSVTAIFLLRSPRAFLVTAGAGVVLLVLPRVVPGWETEDATALSLVLASLAVFGFTQLVQRNQQLSVAQEQVATLAVAQERERIARDMHDVLGHSLTVISVKADLAGRLVERDPARAAAEIADIQALARSALADTRGMVASVRHATLAGELAAARQAFDAAGIGAQLPGAIDAVPEHLREVFAWAVREGTTNVLRHAAATRVVVSLAPDRIVVEDDGRGAAAGAADPRPGADRIDGGDAPGHGLQGLRERAQEAGAVVETGPSPLGGFRLAVRGPLVPGGRIAP